MGKIRTTRRLRSLEPKRRLAAARNFAGKRVKVVRSYLDTPETLTGRCVAAALHLGGGSADLLILEVETTTRGITYRNDGIVAISLAQINSIEEL